jgi:hypothetical protein
MFHQCVGRLARPGLSKSALPEIIGEAPEVVVPEADDEDLPRAKQKIRILQI